MNRKWLYLAAALTGAAQGAVGGFETSATVARDEDNTFSCTSRKLVAVSIKAEPETLPKTHYQFPLGGGFHVICADYNGGSAPAIGRKVRVSFNDSGARILP